MRVLHQSRIVKGNPYKVEERIVKVVDDKISYEKWETIVDYVEIDVALEALKILRDTDLE